MDCFTTEPQGAEQSRPEVFDILCELDLEEFALQDAHAHQQRPQARSPENNTIRDAIRKALQELPEQNLTEFPGGARCWTL